MPWKKKGTSTVSESGAALSATLATAGRRAQIKVNEPTFVFRESRIIETA